MFSAVKIALELHVRTRNRTCDVWFVLMLWGACVQCTLGAILYDKSPRHARVPRRQHVGSAPWALNAIPAPNPCPYSDPQLSPPYPQPPYPNLVMILRRPTLAPILRRTLSPLAPLHNLGFDPQAFKTKHPESNPQQQGRRKTGKPSFKYTGADAEFTDSDDDEPKRPSALAVAAAAALKEAKSIKQEGVKSERDRPAAAAATAVAARQKNEGGSADWDGDRGMNVDGDEVGDGCRGAVIVRFSRVTQNAVLRLPPS